MNAQSINRRINAETHMDSSQRGTVPKQPPVDGATNTSVHSREPETRVVVVYGYSVLKIFINPSIIIESK